MELADHIASLVYYMRFDVNYILNRTFPQLIWWIEQKNRLLDPTGRIGLGDM